MKCLTIITRLSDIAAMIETVDPTQKSHIIIKQNKEQYLN